MSTGGTDVMRQDVSGAGSTARNAGDKLGLGRLTQMFKGNTLVPLLIGGAAVIALAGAFFMWASTPTYRVLFNNLSEADGGRIINELDARAIPYEFGAGGQAILVPGDQVHALRLQLAEQGLPEGGNVGFELMDDQAFGISQFAEQVNYQRSLEGELARSIESLSPVSLARVHLSLAKPSVFIRERDPAKASVVLTLQPGRALGQGRVNGIMHLISSSVPELSPDNVTVVDQAGNLLSDGSARADRVDGEQLSYAGELEGRYQERIENILTPLFGADNIRVQVAADMDFSLREETLESYTPNQGTAAVRSAQQSGSLNGAEALARGIPGALSNTAPGWAPAPIDAPAEEQEQAPAAAPQGQENDNLRYDNVINYEVDRNITHIQHSRGRLQRLSVAAVVNYRPGLDAEGNSVQEALSDEEMTEVTALVRQAMGFNAARGDQLEVVNSLFADTSREAMAPPPWWARPGVQDMIVALGRYLMAALLALTLYWLLLRPLLKRHLALNAAALPAGAGANSAGALESPRQEKLQTDRQQANQANALPSSRRQREGKALTYEEDLRELRQTAKDDPRMVAMVVRTWMNRKD